MIVGDPRATAPAPAQPHDERTFARPVGEGSLSFSQPEEFRMAAHTWRVRLTRPGRPSIDLPRALSIWPLAPWSPDGARFAYQGIDPNDSRRGVILGDADAGYRWLDGVPGGPHAVLWSPRRELVLVGGSSWFRIFAEDGRAMAAGEWPAAPHGVTHAFWLPSGDRFVLIGPVGFSPRRTIRLFASSGDLLAERPLDPVDLVPFNAGDYAHLDRDGFALVLGRSTRAVGWLLDEWSDARYDPDTEELRLLVYRPTGPAERDTSKPARLPAASVRLWVAPAEPRWIAMRLGERGG